MPGSYSRPLDRPSAPAFISCASSSRIRATSSGRAWRRKSSPITFPRKRPCPAYAATLIATGSRSRRAEKTADRHGETPACAPPRRGQGEGAGVLQPPPPWRQASGAAWYTPRSSLRSGPRFTGGPRFAGGGARPLLVAQSTIRPLCRAAFWRAVKGVAGCLDRLFQRVAALVAGIRNRSLQLRLGFGLGLPARREALLLVVLVPLGHEGFPILDVPRFMGLDVFVPSGDVFRAGFRLGHRGLPLQACRCVSARKGDLRVRVQTHLCIARRARNRTDDRPTAALARRLLAFGDSLIELVVCVAEELRLRGLFDDVVREARGFDDGTRVPRPLGMTPTGVFDPNILD